MMGNVLFLTACTQVMPLPGPLAGLGEEPSPVSQGTPPSAHAIVQTARGFVGDSAIRLGGETYRYDCSGLVEASLEGGRCPYKGSSAMLWDEAQRLGVDHRRRIPSPGDIAFFDNTYDRDANGRLDDDLSHVAVVESVDRAGTITLVHVGSKGVVRFRMNLRNDHLNDPLRAKKPNDPPATKYLANQLWRGFASFYKEPALVTYRR